MKGVRAVPKIGVVLSGCAGKGAYELACLCAIADRFGIENIKCLSTASMGSFIGQVYGMGRLEGLKEAFRDIDRGKYGRYIMGFASNKAAVADINSLIAGENEMLYEHYVSMWNFTKKRVEYTPFHLLSGEELPDHARAAISIPIFSKGVVINGDRYLDGAFLDNIPVHPLVDKDLDYVFCVYFDNYHYIFESPEFDKKIIKLYDFPNRGRVEVLFYEEGSFDRMYDYGYRYACDVMDRIFREGSPEAVEKAIEENNQNNAAEFKPRLTADVVLNNINEMARQYSHSPSLRKRVN